MERLPVTIIIQEKGQTETHTSDKFVLIMVDENLPAAKKIYHGVTYNDMETIARSIHGDVSRAKKTEGREVESLCIVKPTSERSRQLVGVDGKRLSS